MGCSAFVAYSFAGAFTANFVPHFVSGVLGRTFPTPFASPAFRGQSSSRVNVLYGLANLAVAYALLSRVGEFEPRSLADASAFGLGLAAMSLLITSSLARLQRAQAEPPGARANDARRGSPKSPGEPAPPIDAQGPCGVGER